MPGALLPGDLRKIAQHLQVEPTPAWITEHFLASSGARVMLPGVPGAFDVPSIVPAQREDGSCVFLDSSSGRCSIHPVSPFGCAYHDDHLDFQEANRRSQFGIRVMMQSLVSEPMDQYGQDWTLLYEHQRLAAPLSVRREAYGAAHDALCQQEVGKDTDG